MEGKIANLCGLVVGKSSDELLSGAAVRRVGGVSIGQRGGVRGEGAGGRGRGGGGGGLGLQAVEGLLPGASITRTLARNQRRNSSVERSNTTSASRAVVRVQVDLTHHSGIQ